VSAQYKFEISELSVERSSAMELAGRMWVYYRRVALLKEFYLLSSLLGFFAESYFLHASLLEGKGRRLDMHARDLLFGKALLVDPLRVLAYSVDLLSLRKVSLICFLFFTHLCDFQRVPRHMF
jgi:hypothetical protein